MNNMIGIIGASIIHVVLRIIFPPHHPFDVMKNNLQKNVAFLHETCFQELHLKISESKC